MDNDEELARRLAARPHMSDLYRQALLRALRRDRKEGARPDGWENMDAYNGVDDREPKGPL